MDQQVSLLILYHHLQINLVMKKILFTILSVAVALSSVSCNKFPHEGTATESIAGDWSCTVYYAKGNEWVPYRTADYMTYNTAANVPTEIWLDDCETFWKTKCKIDADVANLSFGAIGKEYTDIYNDVAQKIFGGKVTKKGAIAPGSGSTVDKIEFFIQFSDDEEPYAYTYYIVGYKYTGFPEDNGNYKDDWDLPAVPAN